MIKFKDLKKNSKYSLKKNYTFTVLTCVIGLFFLSLYGSTTNSLLTGIECVQNYYDNGHFMTSEEIDYFASELAEKDLDYNELYNLSAEELANLGYNEAAISYIHSLNPNIKDKTSLVQRLKIRDGFVKPFLNFASSDLKIIFQNIENVSISIVMGTFSSELGNRVLFSIIAMFVFRMFFVNILKAGYARFFLENSKYHKTKIGRSFLPFTKNYFKVFKAMGRKTLYQFLWNFTIVGGIIKVYSYRLVQYIVAEDSEISSKDAILLSRKLMHGYKWKAFLLDMSFVGWNWLGGMLFGLVGVLFVNPYVEGTYAEFYKAIIRERKDEAFYKEYLNGREYVDKDLYIDEDKDYYPGAKPSPNDFAMQNYSPLTLAVFFFVFAFIGWCLEVLLFLLKTHVFVNRGTLNGPWLPIYGIGCVLILVLFTKTIFRKRIGEPILVFINIMLICGILEYFTSWLLEATTGLKYWDYGGHLLSINGRICLENLCEFGLGGLLCVYLFAPMLNGLVTRVNKKFVVAMVSISLMVFLADCVYVKIHPRTGYGITDAIIDAEGNIIDKDGNLIK